MRIGIDFDNTIVCYDQLFYQLAIEHGCPTDKIAPSKLVIRDYLRSIGKEDQWTMMQGIAYGLRITEAHPFSGVKEFFQSAIKAGHEIFVVSHKTKYPFKGEQYDLHLAARAWLDHHQFIGREMLDHEHVFLELTKEDKLAKIGALSCDYFIDDLPEIFSAPQFPSKTKKVLFDPSGEHRIDAGHLMLSDWNKSASVFGWAS